MDGATHTGMPNYRHYRIPGGCYFFTVNLLKHLPNDLLIRHAEDNHAAEYVALFRPTYTKQAACYGPGME